PLDPLDLPSFPTRRSSDLLGERMPGLEIHAQVLENVFDGALLMRPRWATWAEGLALLVAGLIVVCSVPRLSPGRSTGLLLLLLIDRKSTRLNSSHVAISYA